jgi:hypothetical protein
MSNSIPPEDMGRLFALLGELKDGAARMETQIHDGFRDANDRIDKVSVTAKKAFDQSVDALRLSSDTQVKQSETERAMMSYAQSATSAAAQIVVANDAQTPVIQRTADLMAQLKRQAPVMLAGATVLGMVARELLAPVLSLFHH